MKNNKKILEKYQDLSKSLFLDYLIFTDQFDEILEQSKSQIINSNFLIDLKKRIHLIERIGIYPMEARERIGLILDYIEEHSEGLEQELDECYSELENMVTFSYQKYEEEFSVRQDFLNHEDQATIWTLNDLKESICYDYIVLMSFSSSNNLYIETYLPDFILNRNYIYSIKKLAYIFPELLEQNKEKILPILNLDLKLLENPNQEILKQYLSKNYHYQEKIEFHLQEFEEVKKEIASTMDQVNHLNLRCFDKDFFEFYYDFLKIEQILHFDYKRNFFISDIDSIYAIIEQNNEKPEINGKQKEYLINLLDQKKQTLKPEERQEYNEHLVMLNATPEANQSDVDKFFERCTVLDYLKALYFYYFKKDASYFYQMTTSKKYDLQNFESYLLSEEEFRKNIEEYSKTYYPISVRKFMKECPMMFTDLTVYNRTLEVLSQYQDKETQKYIKKLKKLREK